MALMEKSRERRNQKLFVVEDGFYGVAIVYAGCHFPYSLHYKKVKAAALLGFFHERHNLLYFWILCRCDLQNFHPVLNLFIALRSHLREEQYILNGCLAGHEHGQAVNTYTHT